MERFEKRMRDTRGESRIFIGGVGGGGVAIDYYARTHITSAKPEIPYGRGPGLA